MLELYLGNPHPSRIHFPSSLVTKVPVCALSVGYLHSRALRHSETEETLLFIEISPCFLCCSPSIPVTDSRSPPTNLFIDSETPSSLQVHWTPPDGRVQHYKITYSPVSDAAAQETVSVQLLSRAQTLGQWPMRTILQSGSPLGYQDSKPNLFLLMCCFVNRTPRLFCN